MLDVLEHIDNDRAAVSKVHSMLAPRGALILTVPAHQWLWTRHDDLNQHCRRYSRSSLRRLFAPKHWRLEKVTYLFASLVLPKLLTRCFEALGNADPKTPGIPPAWLNTLAKTWLDMERKVFSRIPIAVGSSLLLIGRRTG